MYCLEDGMKNEETMENVILFKSIFCQVLTSSLTIMCLSIVVKVLIYIIIPTIWNS